MSDHLSAYEPMFPCGKCGRRFYAENHVKAHLKTTHNIILPPVVYQCDQCPKSYKAKILLEQHQRKHKGVLPFVCPKCTKAFRLHVSLKIHLQAHEQRQHNFVCEVCGKGFPNIGGLRNHSAMHQERDIECPVCGWKTNSKNYLRAHIKANHKKKRLLHCAFCDKTSTSEFYLRRHQLTHDDEAPVVTFDCHLCSNKFKTREGLGNHLKRHQGKLEFECDLCDAAYINKTYLSRHRFEKHGIMPHKCKECGQEYALLSLLNSHMHKKHFNLKALNSLNA